MTDTNATSECLGELIQKLLCVINRQKAEIERLQDDKNRLEKMMDNLAKDLDAQMKRNF